MTQSLTPNTQAIALLTAPLLVGQRGPTSEALTPGEYKRLARFGDHMARVGRALGQGVDAYNSAVGSLERQVLPGARKFTELGLRPGKEIEELLPVEKLAREPRPAETDGDDEPRDGA